MPIHLIKKGLLEDVLALLSLVNLTLRSCRYVLRAEEEERVEKGVVEQQALMVDVLVRNRCICIMIFDVWF